MDGFKNTLDKWLNTISYGLQIPEYTANWHAESNSIHHMTTSGLKKSRTVSIHKSQIEAAQLDDLEGLWIPQKQPEEVRSIFSMVVDITAIKRIMIPIH